jgi:hypothetical protein
MEEGRKKGRTEHSLSVSYEETEVPNRVSLSWNRIGKDQGPRLCINIMVCRPITLYL